MKNTKIFPKRRCFLACRLLFAGGVLFGLAACSPSKRPDTEADVAVIKAMSSDRAAAFVRGDAAGIAKHFTENAVLMPPNSPTLTGRKAVQDYYQAIFDANATQLDSRYDEVKVDGDLAYGRGFAEVTVTPKSGGAPVRSTAKCLNILQRQPDGTWKTTHDIWNAN